MSGKFISIALLALAVFNWVACKQSDPEPLPTAKGDIYFSGYYWNIKNSKEIKVGPGPNAFTNSPKNIWLDGNNLLHLKITKDSTGWHCSELISAERFGYGRFIFTTASDLTTLNERAVFGLFTWDNYSFQTQANSEVDIEFARWNNASDSLLLTYSAQPVWFDNAAPYAERTNKPAMQVSKLKGNCTHMFKWTPQVITWESYEGDVYPGTNLLASWKFDNTNLARKKLEGGLSSNPIVIPAPGDSTNVRFNLWLLNGLAPANGSESEVVIKSFRYIPL